MASNDSQSRRRWWRDPLIAFLLAGALIAVVYRIAAERGDSYTIRVDEADLLSFLQYRHRSFEPAAARARLDALSPGEREQLIRDYVREEALVREARSLGLDANDFVIRQRLIQKLEFIARGSAEVALTADDETLRQWYDTRRDDYREEATLTFTHAFIAARDANSAARDRVEALRDRLNAERVPFDAAPGHGERFLYHTNYVDRTPTEVSSHFGEGFAAALTRLSPDPHRWQGPLASRYGWHVVLLTTARPARVAAFEDVRDRVAHDWRRSIERERIDRLTDEIVARYTVVSGPALKGD